MATDPQLKALDSFFRSAVQNLSAASTAVIHARADQLKEVTKAELKTAFKRRVGGVSVRKLGASGSLGPAAYVSVKPLFLAIFEEGGTISGKGKLLVVRTPEAAKARLPRPGKAGWPALWARIQDRSRLVKSASGWLVLVKVGKKKEIVAYILTRQVVQKKRLNFRENAERIARGMADEIVRLTEGRL